MIYISKSKDYLGLFLNVIFSNQKDLPSPLPWIEPSINKLHLEASTSFLIGNYECVIIACGMLLEHVLRLALVSDEQCGLQRDASITEIDSYNSLAAIINAAEDKDFFKECNIEWWKRSAKILRNKSAHYLLPEVIKQCAESSCMKHYLDGSRIDACNDKEYYEKILLDWGSFYHRAGHSIAKHFLQDTTAQVKILIERTQWHGDESWWISQKHEYDAFFKYKWNLENLKCSIEQNFTLLGHGL